MDIGAVSGNEAIGVSLRLRDEVVLCAPDRVAMARTLATLLPNPEGALQVLEGVDAWGPVHLGRAAALDCCAALLEASDRAAAAGECVAAFALLGMESRLLDALLGASGPAEEDQTWRHR